LSFFNQSTIFADIEDKQRFSIILNNFQKEKEAVIIIAQQSGKKYNYRVFQLIKQYGWKKGKLLFKKDKSEAYIMQYIGA
jgi:hypothetical protein